MSSDRSPSHRIAPWSCALALCISTPLEGQDRANEAPQEVEPREPRLTEGGRIDILVTAPRRKIDEAQVRECLDRADAGRITGEIVVCREIGESGEHYYSASREEAQRRYAEETAFDGTPRAPDVAGSGIFRGPASISGACFIPPCPGEPPLLIDLEALPEAPEGSDADRIARGLPPLGAKEPSAEEIARRRRELGLPAPPVGDR